MKNTVNISSNYQVWWICSYVLSLSVYNNDKLHFSAMVTLLVGLFMIFALKLPSGWLLSSDGLDGPV